MLRIIKKTIYIKCYFKKNCLDTNVFLIYYGNKQYDRKRSMRYSSYIQSYKPKVTLTSNQQEHF